MSFSNLLKPFTAQKSVESLGKGNNIISLDKMISNHIRKALDIAGGRIQGVGGAAELLEILTPDLKTKY